MISPTALRLVGSTDKLPFGLAKADESARDVLVALDLAPDADSVAAVAALLPRADSLEPGAYAIVLPTRPKRGGLLARLRTPAPVSRAHRASALLACGYVDIEADVDDKSGLDLVWGKRPAD